MIPICVGTKLLVACKCMSRLCQISPLNIVKGQSRGLWLGSLIQACPWKRLNQVTGFWQKDGSFAKVVLAIDRTCLTQQIP